MEATNTDGNSQRQRSMWPTYLSLGLLVHSPLLPNYSAIDMYQSWPLASTPCIIIRGGSILYVRCWNCRLSNTSTSFQQERRRIKQKGSVEEEGVGRYVGCTHSIHRDQVDEPNVGERVAVMAEGQCTRITAEISHCRNKTLSTYIVQCGASARENV
jgi:hypothetical protein